MDTLAILLPILMVGPAINRDADPELPRRSGLQTEATLGAAGLSGARDDGWQSMLGFTGSIPLQLALPPGGTVATGSHARGVLRPCPNDGSSWQAFWANGYGAFTLALS